MTIKYEKVTFETGEAIKATNEDNVDSWIPVDLANSDYQAYLEATIK
ncbi:hypothetical protein UFOVP1262_10 [uncultured Caudovirales phage]|uniref:Uncharacterized protein n=1 Tax=uncultured Caudovirales phage TaxID=2100421 RepID=A0A6J5RQN3_9CAUD|nr:hypothetical protein UFOVP863_9 [uncultured Caudovirales phage]CAB4180278.1 hypothetical protein UFOVP1042_15 [uncultured Caudovirales phage]CAB4194124.1 hypothetical protein UFOVP1262_10 [uncultured Caudovirales phage]